jgi:hypothetical protein
MEFLASKPTQTYWLTRFVLLRWLGLVYLVAFFAAARQLVPLVGANGLTPASLFIHQLRQQWFLYMSIVHVGQDWYGYGWEIQMIETGFLAIFLCPLLDARPFSAPARRCPVIFLFRWLIFRIMLGSALIKLRGDSCWRDLTALYYHFRDAAHPESDQPLVSLSSHPVLQFGVIWTFVVELGAPWFASGRAGDAYIAGSFLIISFNSR